MQQPVYQSKTTLISTACGTILSIFNSVSAQDLVKTSILAAVGATTSFIVSVLLKWTLRSWKLRKDRKQIRR